MRLVKLRNEGVRHRPAVDLGVAQSAEVYGRLEAALESGKPLRVDVSGCDVDPTTGRRRLRVSFGAGVIGHLPEGEIGHPRPRRIDEMIGWSVFVRIKSVDRALGQVQLSRREALEELIPATWQALEPAAAGHGVLQEELRQALGHLRAIAAENGGKSPETDELRARIDELRRQERAEAPVVVGCVRWVSRRGAGVEVGGLVGWLPVEEMTWSHAPDARQLAYVRRGASLKLAVLAACREKEFLRLSLRPLLPDPWDRAGELYPPGTKHRGRVACAISTKGYLVELDGGLTGYAPRPGPQSLIPGAEVLVLVTRLDPSQRRMGLRVLEVFAWEPLLKR